MNPLANVEAHQLMYYVAKPEVFNEYGIAGNSFTLLESGNVFGHISHCNNMAVVAHGDDRIVPHTAESLMMYIEYVDGYAYSNM